MKLLLVCMTLLALSSTLSARAVDKKEEGNSSSSSLTVNGKSVEIATTEPVNINGERNLEKKEEFIFEDDKQKKEDGDENDDDDDESKSDEDDDDKESDDDKDDDENEEFDDVDEDAEEKVELPLIATNFSGLIELKHYIVTSFMLSHVVGPLSRHRYKYIQRDGKTMYVYSAKKLDEPAIRQALEKADRLRLQNIAFAKQLHDEAVAEMQALSESIRKSRLRFNQMFFDQSGEREFDRFNKKEAGQLQKRDEIMDSFRAEQDKLNDQLAKFKKVVSKIGKPAQ